MATVLCGCQHPIGVGTMLWGWTRGKRGETAKVRETETKKEGKCREGGSSAEPRPGPAKGTPFSVSSLVFFPPFPLIAPQPRRAPPPALPRGSGGGRAAGGRSGAAAPGCAEVGPWGRCGAVVGPAGVGAVWGLCGTCTGPVWDMRGLRRIHMGPAWVRSLLKALWGPWDPCRPDPPPLSGA